MRRWPLEGNREQRQCDGGPPPPFRTDPVSGCAPRPPPFHAPSAGRCRIEDLTGAYTARAGACPLAPRAPPLRVTQASASDVTVEVSQAFAPDALEWVAADCVDPADPAGHGADPTGADPARPTCAGCCPRAAPAPPGPMAPRRCLCVGGYATVAVYVHDGRIGAGPLEPPVPAHCGPAGGPGNTCRFVYRVPCGCGVCVCVCVCARARGAAVCRGLAQCGGVGVGDFSNIKISNNFFLPEKQKFLLENFFVRNFFCWKRSGVVRAIRNGRLWFWWL